jgi:hypothetical protein
MKATDKPELSKKWWTKEKSADIKGKELEKALGECESALADAKKKEDDDTIQAALDSLDEVSDAVDKTVSKECDKKKHKDLITVLEKFDKLIGDKKKELEKAQEGLAKESNDKDEEDGDEDAKTVFKPEYLSRMIKMLRGGEILQFALGLDKQAPSQSCLVLCNKRKPERLHKMLKQKGEFSNRLITFGTAKGEGKVLELTLSEDAKEPSQIVKTAKEFFKGHRDLKYRKIRVLAGGEAFEEDMPEEEGAPATSSSSTASTGDLQDRLRKAEAASLAWRKAQASVSDQIAQVQRELNAFDDPDAISVHDGLSSLVGNLPDPEFDALAQSTDPNVFSTNLGKTRQRIADLQKMFAEGGPFHTVDANPFVPTNIVGTVSTTLDQIAKDLQIA